MTKEQSVYVYEKHFFILPRFANKKIWWGKTYAVSVWDLNHGHVFDIQKFLYYAPVDFMALKLKENTISFEKLQEQIPTR